jgi:hypothetical protein
VVYLAKPKRTAAQKAATKKLVAFNKRKATKSTKKSTAKKRKTTPKKRKTTTTNKRSTPKRTMAKKRFTRARKTGKSISSSLKTGVIGEVVKGIGAGSLVSLVMSRVAPNSPITPIAATGAAFLTGGLVGGAANLIVSGGLGQLGGMFGGGASMPQEEFGV